MEAFRRESSTVAMENMEEEVNPLLNRLARGFCSLVADLGYKIETRGAANVPTDGGAVIAPNHVSYPDALFIMRAARRPVRFIMDRDIYGWPLLNSICRMLRVIPVSEKDGRRRLGRFVTECREGLARGELLCIFPEGMVTRTGGLNEFKSGYTWLTRGLDVPVIPARIDGAWGSSLSHAHGKLMAKLPSLSRLAITVTFGAPLPATVPPAELRAAVEGLR